MDVTESCESTDVVIVGCGPTGALLSALLGRFGIPNVVLERDAAITEDPRGIALDDDGIRQLQAVGIYDKVYTEIGSCKSLPAFLCKTCQDIALTNYRRHWLCEFYPGRRWFAHEALHENKFWHREYRWMAENTPPTNLVTGARPQEPRGILEA
jgi:choline dehydrogenase-like flavoprotein